MRALALSGRRSEALAQYETCCQALAEAFGVEPARETRALYEQIRTGELKREGRGSRIEDRESKREKGGWKIEKPSSRQIVYPPSSILHPLSSAPPPLRAPAPLHNLPAQPTPFVGRENELADITRRLDDPTCRLMTLVGLGGMGKTRLALAVAEAQLSQSRFSNGVYFVSLAPLSDPEAILSAMAEAVGYPFQSDGRSPQQQLLDYFRQKQMLLILDNFEHLLAPPLSPPEGGKAGGAEFVAEILQTASQVKILATSRERLHLHQEQLYPLHGLAIPATGATEAITGYAAVELFVQSACRSRPDFEVTPADVPYLTGICHLVEGMPLALELAASWVDMLSPADIAAEIQQSFSFLATEMRNVPQRHRSMRAVFDASWQRLNGTEQQIFAQLSLFRGGFTREAAQEVTGASLRTLAGLANKSLLHFNPSRDRYEIHELLRQYGAEKLEAQTAKISQMSTSVASEVAAVRNRHSAYYCAFLHQRETDLKGPRQQSALAQIEADSENALAAWQWALKREQVARLGQAHISLALFFLWRGRFNEGETMFRLAVERMGPEFLAGAKTEGPGRAWGQRSERARVLVQLLTWHGLFYQELGQTEVARQTLQQALMLLDHPVLAGQDTQSEKAHVLLQLVHAAPMTGLEEARQLGEQSLAIYRTLGDSWATANALHGLAGLAFKAGAFAKGQLFLEEALAIRQALGGPEVADTLLVIGAFLANQGQFTGAQRYLQQSVELSDQRSDPIRAGVLFEELAFTLIHLGRYETALGYTQRALALFQDLGLRSSILVAAQMNLGALWLASGVYPKARQILQESVTTAREISQEWRLGESLPILGYVARAMGDNDGARHYLVETLKLAREIGTPYPLSFSFALAALLWSDQGEKERAIELYALASHEPLVANSAWFEDVAGRHMAEVAATLPPDAVTAAKERGRARDLWETAAELLAELQGAGPPN